MIWLISFYLKILILYVIDHLFDTPGALADESIRIWNYRKVRRHELREYKSLFALHLEINYHAIAWFLFCSQRHKAQRKMRGKLFVLATLRE